MLANANVAQAVPASALGILDASSDILQLDFDLLPPELTESVALQGKRRPKPTKAVNVTLAVEQNLSRLRSDARHVDTSSAVWRISLALAKELLLPSYFPTWRSFLDIDGMRAARVLELGSGCGREPDHSFCCVCPNRAARSPAMLGCEAIPELARHRPAAVPRNPQEERLAQCVHQR
jgi:hypothetical protein